MLDRIAAGRTDLVFDWLRQGAGADALVGGASLLSWCAYYGDVSAMRLLLDSGADLKQLGSNLGLNGAAFHGHWRLCEYLLEHGAEPNFAAADTGETALHAALCRKESASHEQVVSVLLAWRADPNRKTIPNIETGSFMRDARTRGESPLHRAAACGAPRTIALLLDAGARIDQRDAHGDSPLSWASWAQRDDAVLRLLLFEPFKIAPGRQTMERYLTGTPLGSPANNG